MNGQTNRVERDLVLAGALRGLDRCQHGRHQGEPCRSCPGQVSAGNPHLTCGQKVGYDHHGTPLFVPSAGDFSDIEAWRTPPQDATAADDPDTNAVYRERNRLVAALAARWPSVITPAPDYPGFWIVYLASPAGQLSWHVPEHSMDSFKHVRQVDTWEWDGHSTQEKYERLALASTMRESTA